MTLTTVFTVPSTMVELWQFSTVTALKQKVRSLIKDWQLNKLYITSWEKHHLYIHLSSTMHLIVLLVLFKTADSTRRKALLLHMHIPT